MRPILLDLDDTLIDDRTATTLAFQAFVEAHRAVLPVEPLKTQLDRWRSIMLVHWVRHERGELSFIEQRRARVRAFLRQELSDTAADAALQPYLAVYETSWRLTPGAAEFLEQSREIPKAVLTNGERSLQLQKMAAVGLTPHVSGVVTPADCGHWKPHPSLFLAGVRLLGTRPEECIMLGDDHGRDIAPARELGMHCIHVTPGQTAAAFAEALRVAGVRV